MGGGTVTTLFKKGRGIGHINVDVGAHIAR